MVAPTASPMHPRWSKAGALMAMDLAPSFTDFYRPNEDLDQLVKEVMEDEAALKAVVGGNTELLIFPSVVLPEKFHSNVPKEALPVGSVQEQKDKRQQRHTNELTSTGNVDGVNGGPVQESKNLEDGKLFQKKP